MMHIRRRGIKRTVETFFVNDERIGVVEEYKYLGCMVNDRLNPLNANDADRRHRIRKRVSANDAFRRHKLARAIRVVFLYLRASERNVTLGAPVAVVGPSHSYLIVSSGRTRGAQSSAALCAKFHAVLLD